MRISFIIVILCFCLTAEAQIGVQKNTQTTYLFEQVYDSATGIFIYEKLNKQMGGDSTRYTPKGYSAQNTWEDYYKSGKLLHRGYYIDGQLKSYKNYYENGQEERNFHMVDYFRYQMTLYYDNGQLRSDIVYYNGDPETTKEYYANGNPEFIEEMAKKNEYLILRQFYYENGKPQNTMELLDKKKKTYVVKEYYETGYMQTEGQMKYYEELDNYMKEGIWKVYDEAGRLIATEEYTRGQLIEEKKLN